MDNKWSFEINQYKKWVIYGTFMKTGNHSDNSQYKLYKNKLNNITRKSKSNHYKNYFAKYKPGIKKHEVE